jgi:adenosylhomocysteine nucleosidase
MKRIAIVAAMPGELKPLVRGWQHERRDGINLWTRESGDQQWIATCAGAGRQAATRAFAAIEQSGPLDTVISIGWVGALAEQFTPGCAYRVSGVIDQRTGERFQPLVLRAIFGSLLAPALPMRRRSSVWLRPIAPDS